MLMLALACAFGVVFGLLLCGCALRTALDRRDICRAVRRRAAGRLGRGRYLVVSGGGHLISHSPGAPLLTSDPERATLYALSDAETAAARMREEGWQAAVLPAACVCRYPNP